MNDLSALQQARWIGSAHPFDLHEVYLNFRAPVLILTPSEINDAQLFISADSRYRLWINGRFVARGPERCYPDHQLVDRLDVAAYLQPGINCLAAQVYQPGYSHFSYVHRGAAGLIAALITDGDVRCVSDATWRVCRDPSWSDQVKRISIYGSGVEERDLRLADDWQTPRFDDSAWQAARIAALPGDAPWTGLEPRTMPLLKEREHALTLVETRCGPTAAEADPHLALEQAWARAQPKPIPMNQEEWHAPSLSEEETAFWLFDLGRSLVTQGWAEIENAMGGETLSISYAEKQRGGVLVLSDPTTYCRMRVTDRFRLGTGEQTAGGFSLRGGRFLLFALHGPAPSYLRIRFHARISEYPLAANPAADIEQMAPEDQRIARLCERSLFACLQDSFIDCVWREQSQWLGDALPQALTLAAMSDDVRPLRKAITMAPQGAYPDGLLPSILPGEVHAYAVLDYNFTWVELLTFYLAQTGDRDFVARLQPTLARMLARFDRHVSEDGLLRSQPGRRLFLDWSPISRREPNALYNLRYLYALQQAVALAQTLPGGADAAELWIARLAGLQPAITDAFWADGRWYDDAEQTTFSQTSAAFALLTGSTPAHAVADQLDQLAARSRDPSDEPAPGKMVLASPFLHHYVLDALIRHGRDEDALAVIRLRWGRWADAGAPATWENWNVDFPDGSQSHAFSAHPRYHLAEIYKHIAASNLRT